MTNIYHLAMTYLSITWPVWLWVALSAHREQYVRLEQAVVEGRLRSRVLCPRVVVGWQSIIRAMQNLCGNLSPDNYQVVKHMTSIYHLTVTKLSLTWLTYCKTIFREVKFVQIGKSSILLHSSDINLNLSLSNHTHDIMCCNFLNNKDIFKLQKRIWSCGCLESPKLIVTDLYLGD